MKVLIIGGTGILSYDFTKKVIENGYDVYLLNRGKTSSDFDDSCKLIYCDIRKENPNTLREKLSTEKYDVVVDFLSYDSEQVKRTLLSLSDCYGRYVFISTAMVYGNGEKEKTLDESSPINKGIWDYADKKIDAEEYVKNNVKDYLIIRPYITYGKKRVPYQMAPDKYYYTLIKRILDGKPIPMVNQGEALCSLTNTIDFANILYGLINCDNIHNEVFNIVSDEVVKWKDIYYTICTLLNVKPNLFSINMEEVKSYLPEYYDSLKCGKGMDYIVCGEKARSVIGGYSCYVSMEEGIKQCLDYYMEEFDRQGIDYRWDGRIDYAYRKTQKKICKFSPTKGNKDRSTNYLAYYFMQNVFLRKTYKCLKKSLYE